MVVLGAEFNYVPDGTSFGSITERKGTLLYQEGLQQVCRTGNPCQDSAIDWWYWSKGLYWMQSLVVHRRMLLSTSSVNKKRIVRWKNGLGCSFGWDIGDRNFWKSFTVVVVRLIWWKALFCTCWEEPHGPKQSGNEYNRVSGSFILIVGKIYLAVVFSTWKMYLICEVQ